MHILIVEVHSFTPHLNSGSNRLYEIIKILQKFADKITFVSDFKFFGETERIKYNISNTHLVDLNEINNWKFPKKVIGKNVDIIYYSKVYAAEKFGMLQDIYPNAKVVFDTVDLHYLRLFRRAKQKKDARFLRLALELKKKEIKAALCANWTLTVSEDEKKRLLNLVPNAQIEVVSNIHYVKNSIAKYEERNGLIFIGSFNHAPNVDALEFLLEDIFPSIKRVLPHLKLYIIGKNPPSYLVSKHSDNLEFTGYVKNLEAIFAKALASLAPMRFGAGIKGKILTSWSLGVPVIGTAQAFLGMVYNSQIADLKAESAFDFTEVLSLLTTQPTKWKEYSENGRATIKKYYSKKRAFQIFSKIFDQSIRVQL